MAAGTPAKACRPTGGLSTTPKIKLLEKWITARFIVAKVDTPCPECSQTPVEVLDMLDGQIWICPACGYQELSAGVDINAQLNVLADYDPDLAAAWRYELGI